MDAGRTESAVTAILATLVVPAAGLWLWPGPVRAAEQSVAQDGDNAADGDGIQRREKSVEELLFELKRLHLYRGSSRRDEELILGPREALIAMGPTAVPRLCEALGQRDRYPLETICYIAEILGEIGDPRAEDALVAAIVEGPRSRDSIDTVSYYGRVPEALKKVGCKRIEPLLEMLGSPDETVRHNGILALGNLGDPRAFEPLVGLLKTGDLSHTFYVVSALKDVDGPRAVPVLIDQMDILIESNDISNHVTRNAISRICSCLQEIGDRRAVEPLIAVLESGPKEHASSAALALEELADPRALRPLIAALNPPDLDASRSANDSVVDALARIGGPEAAEALVHKWKELARAAQEEGSSLSRNAHVTLHNSVYRVGQPCAPLLIAELEDHDSPIRVDAAFHLGAIGERKAVDLLIDTMWEGGAELFRRPEGSGLPPIPVVPEDTSDDLFMACIESLGRIGDPKATGALVAALERDGLRASRFLSGVLWQETNPAEAAYALASLDPPAIEPLCNGLNHSEETVRRACARALGWLADTQALPGMIEAFHRADSGGEDDVCRYLLQGIGKIGDAQTIDIVAGALKNRSDIVRQYAVSALCDIGGPDVVPHLIEALDDNDTHVAQLAADGLGDIADPRSVEPLIRSMGCDEQTVAITLVSGADRTSVTYGRTPWECNSEEKALIQIGGPAVEPLLEVLTGPSVDTTFGAIRVLTSLGDIRAVEPLVEKLEDPNPEIRLLAGVALAEFGEGRAIPALLKMAVQPLHDSAATDRSAEEEDALGLRDIDSLLAKLYEDDSAAAFYSYVNWGLRVPKNPAADALWYLGLDAVDPLIAALDDPDPYSRQVAERALKIIGEPRGLEAIAKRAAESALP